MDKPIKTFIADHFFLNIYEYGKNVLIFKFDSCCLMKFEKIQEFIDEYYKEHGKFKMLIECSNIEHCVDMHWDRNYRMIDKMAVLSDKTNIFANVNRITIKVFTNKTKALDWLLI